jgi:hypothetical protein
MKEQLTFTRSDMPQKAIPIPSLFGAIALFTEDMRHG